MSTMSTSIVESLQLLTRTNYDEDYEADFQFTTNYVEK